MLAQRFKYLYSLPSLYAPNHRIWLCIDDGSPVVLNCLNFIVCSTLLRLCSSQFTLLHIRHNAATAIGLIVDYRIAIVKNNCINFVQYTCLLVEISVFEYFATIFWLTVSYLLPWTCFVGFNCSYC